MSDEITPAVPGKIPADFPDALWLRPGDKLFFSGEVWVIKQVVIMGSHGLSRFLQLEIRREEAPHAGGA